MVQRKEAIKLKEEYHTFRDRSGVILFALAAVLLVGLLRADAKRKAGEPFSLTPPFMVGVQAFLAWLLYFYTALALRENVLKVCEAARMPSHSHLALPSRGLSPLRHMTCPLSDMCPWTLSQCFLKRIQIGWPGIA